MAGQGSSEDEIKFSKDKKLEFFHPVDHGWAWIIMIAVFGIHLMSMGYERSFGMLYVEFQERYKISASMTSAINGAKSFVYCIATMLAMNFAVKKMSVRVISFTGCLFQFVGVTASSFVPNSIYLIVTLGILYGLGHAMVYCPSLLLLNQYFERRRPIAVTIASCGSCLGGIVFPYLSSYLLTTYGLQGTLMMLASMLLQQLICIAAYTPPDDYKPNERLESTASAEEVSACGITINLASDPEPSTELPTKSLISSLAEPQDSGESVRIPITADDLFLPRYRSKSYNHVPPAIKKQNLQSSENLKQRSLSQSQHVLSTFVSNHEPYHRHRQQPYRFHDNQRHISSSRQFNEALIGSGSEQINASMPSLVFNDTSGFMEISHRPPPSPPHQHRPGSQISSSGPMIREVDDSKCYQRVPQTTDVEEHSVKKTRCQCFCKLPSVMKLPSFWVLCLFFVCGVVGTGHPAIFIPPLAMERGLKEQDASFFLMVSSFAEVFGRLIPGLILHFNLMRPTTVIVFPLLACAVAYHLSFLYTQFYSLMVFTLIYGLLNSCFWSLQTLIVIEVLGLDKLASAIGFYAIFMGVSSTVAFPVAGALKDITGTYNSTFHFFGVLYSIAAASIIGVHFLKKRNEGDERDDDNVSDDEVDDNDDEKGKSQGEDADISQSLGVNVDELTHTTDKAK